MKRVAVYIDGFNLYHAIDSLKKPHLKWLDLTKLAESFLRKNEILIAAYYFSAYATWRTSFSRHREYVKALHAAGVQTCMGKFKEKPVKCRMCGTIWMTHEEKETDVNIAVKIVEDAAAKTVDRMILISADSDLKPALISARRLNPLCEVFVASPPNRFRMRDLNPKIEISPGRLAKCLLPQKLKDTTGKMVAIRPIVYDPPIFAKEHELVC